MAPIAGAGRLLRHERIRRPRHERIRRPRRGRIAFGPETSAQLRPATLLLVGESSHGAGVIG
jgi:hypothetical protein